MFVRLIAFFSFLFFSSYRTGQWKSYHLHLPVRAMPSSREDIKFEFYLGKVRRETQVKRPNKSKLKDDSLTNIPLTSQSFSTACQLEIWHSGQALRENPRSFFYSITYCMQNANDHYSEEHGT